MNYSNLYSFFQNISAFSVVIPIGLCLIRFKYLNRVSILMFIYLIFSLLAEAFGAYVSTLLTSNSFVLDIFTLFELAFVVAMFLDFLKPKAGLKILFIGLTCLGYAFYIFGIILDNQILFNSFCALYLFGLSLFFIFNEDRELNIPNLLQNYFYWYNVGFLIYFGTEFFLQVFDDFIVSAKYHLGIYLYTIHLITNLILYAAISIGIWKTKST